MRSYFAALLPEENGAYSVLFPDLPGCQTCGDTLEEAFAMALDALAVHLQAMLEDDENIPSPSGLEEALRKLCVLCGECSLDTPDAPLMQLVPAPDLDNSLVRVSVSFRRSTLHQIDRKAEQAGMSRSAFLAAASTGYTPHQSV